MSVGEAAADVQRGLTLTTPGALAAAQSLFAEAFAMIAPLAAETSRPELPQAAAYLAQLLAELDRTRAALAAARQAMTDLVTAWVGTGGGTVCEAKPPPGPVELKPAPTAGEMDQRAAELLAKLPQRSGVPGQKTSGYWIAEDGTEQGPLMSGQDEDYDNAKAVLRDLNIGPRFGELFAASHVETKFAARLRGSGLKRVVLAINNQPCSDGRFSCDQLLPQILGADQEVTLYWPGGKETYRGWRQ